MSATTIEKMLMVVGNRQGLASAIGLAVVITFSAQSVQAAQPVFNGAPCKKFQEGDVVLAPTGPREMIILRCSGAKWQPVGTSRAISFGSAASQ
jgi:hypothetical protein